MEILDWAEGNAEKLVQKYLDAEPNEVFSQNELKNKGDYYIGTESSGDGETVFVDICFGDEFEKHDNNLEKNYEYFTRFAEDISDNMNYDVTVMTNSEVLSVDTSGAGVKAKIKTQTGEVFLEADIVLSAVGVLANIENIGLETVGIKTEKGKIMVDAHGQTNVPGIYAIGDCTPGQALAHVASKEGINAAEHLSGHHPEPIDYNNIPGCTYCSPEIASVGYTEKAAKEAGYEVKVGKFPYMASGKASAAGATEGFVKVIYDAKYGEFLGCHMIGMNVTENIAEAVAARKLETTSHEILNSVHPHPTMSEGLKEATAVAYGEAIDI
jgi:dihydrolipoamide dehydrogenase